MKCLNCNAETDNPRFCGRSCSASYNNRKHPKRSAEGSCRTCNISIPRNRTFCQACFAEGGSRSRKVMDSWLAGDYQSTKIAQTIRNYLLEQANFACQKCGFSERHPDDGKPILEINHINGDGSDHSPENLEVICPNCHAMTSTYRNRNRGSGRPVYYLRRSI